jgi:hypothetical protein
MVGPPDLGDPVVGAASGGALFALAMAILVWPFVRRLVLARRQRAIELRIASGHGADDRK